jgi:hypothetical protein
MRPLVHLAAVAACLLLDACSKSSSSASSSGVASTAASDRVLVSSPSDAAAPSATTPAVASSGAGEGKFAHPCSILQRADAEAILGTKNLREEEQPGPPGDARCAWSVKDARGIVELYIQIPSRKRAFDRSSADRTPVPALGDKAYVQKRQTWGHVDVLKGEQTFFVQVERSNIVSGAGPDPAGLSVEVIALAKKVASRM